jgi:hypothetical protein
LRDGSTNILYGFQLIAVFIFCRQPDQRIGLAEIPSPRNHCLADVFFNDLATRCRDCDKATVGLQPFMLWGITSPSLPGSLWSSKIVLPGEKAKSVPFCRLHGRFVNYLSARVCPRYWPMILRSSRSDLSLFPPTKSWLYRG